MSEYARQAPEPSPRGREAYLKQYVDRPSGDPARRQACPSDVSAVAVETFVNDAGQIELTITVLDNHSRRPYHDAPALAMSPARAPFWEHFRRWEISL